MACACRLDVGVLLRFGVDYAGIGGDVDSITTTALALAETRVWNEEVTLRAIFEGFEAGAEMAEVRTGDWNTLGRDASRVRTDVFVHEQGIPAEVEADRHDIPARHAVLYNRLGMPVAAGRLLQHAPGVGRIGRMAVDRSVRGAQWGRQLLDALVDAARALGDAEVQLHAQRSAEGFYRRAGFTVVGEPYEEAGIAHIAMARKL